jgi:Ankyrin repeats (3 copies)
MTENKAKPAKPAKPPAERTIKSFFKLLELGKLDDVEKQLPKLGPNLRYNTGYGEEPALVAAAGARAANVDVVRVLLDAGAEIEGTDSRGQTALHAACKEGSLGIVELLVDRGASLTAKTEDGLRPYALAKTAPIRKRLRAAGDPGFGPRGGKTLKPKVHANAKNMEISRGALGLDREGGAWFGGYSGLFRYDGKAMTRYAFEESIAISSIDPGPPGVVYIATNWGLIEFNDNTFTLFSSENSELFDNHITDMSTAPDGRAYIVSYESGADHKHITVFDGTTFTVLEPGVDFPADLEITCLVFDQAGELAIGANNAFTTRRDGAWHVEREFGGVYSARIYDAIVERDAAWIATSHGLIVYRDGAYSMIRMPTDAAYTVCKDGDAVWIGYREGIGRLVGTELSTIAKAGSELPDDDVKRIVRAPDGRVWIHAGAGAAYLENGEIRRFD